MELEKWRLKLLDIGKRNRLINFLDTKNSSVSILAPDIEKLFKMLNSENKYEIVTVDKKETKLFSDDDNKITGLCNTIASISDDSLRSYLWNIWNLTITII